MKHLITLGFLIAAAVMYAFGSELGSGILVGLGMWSELVLEAIALRCGKEGGSPLSISGAEGWVYNPALALIDASSYGIFCRAALASA